MMKKNTTPAFFSLLDRLCFVFPILVLTFTPIAFGAENSGTVKLAVQAERSQPAGFPLVVKVEMTNVGDEPIQWWWGGPADYYPAATHFVVGVRYGGDRQWHSVEATNGQYILGSGVYRKLEPGKSVVVPLAIPVHGSEGVRFRIRPRGWRAAQPARGYVQISSDRDLVDNRRARLIEAAISQNEKFWHHMAAKYPDPLVIKAMLKLVSLDNMPIVRGASEVLERQDKLSISAGALFAKLVERWLPRKPQPEWQGLRSNIVAASLKTQNEKARNAIIRIMTQTKDPATRGVAMNGLCLSSGGVTWLRRAKSAIAALEPLGEKDAGLARKKKRATEWLDSEIANQTKDDVHK